MPPLRTSELQQALDYVIVNCCLQRGATSDYNETFF